MTKEVRAWADRPDEARLSPGRHAGPRPIVVGLVNNMPDAALLATEAQFHRLIQAASGEREVQLKLFYLPEVPRSDRTRADLETRYRSVDALASSGVDALIVTGAEPRAATLQEEPYWSRLASMVDWAKTQTVSTVWSCLAAHAAVLHLDGVRRRPVTPKCSGVFAIERVDPHPLTLGEASLLVPHSRVNAVLEPELIAAGYRMLTRSSQIGVDAFVRDEPSLFVFLQGHPEYDPLSLQLEYQRDLRRFLRQERPDHPNIPQGYFSAKIEERLNGLAERARTAPSPSMLSQAAKIIQEGPPVDRWSGWSAQLYRNWLDLIEARRVCEAANA